MISFDVDKDRLLPFDRSAITSASLGTENEDIPLRLSSAMSSTEERRVWAAGIRTLKGCSRDLTIAVHELNLASGLHDSARLNTVCN